MNLIRFAEFYQIFLGIIWMNFNLKNCWFNLTRAQQVSYQGYIEVRDSDVFNQSLLYQLFHSSPCFKNGYRVFNQARFISFGIMNPFRWISNLWVDIFQADWEMNQIEIKVFKPQIFECSQTCWSDMLLFVESIPQLRCYKQILSLNDAIINCSFNSLSNFFFISIITCTIKQFIPTFKGLINDIRANVFRHFPSSESHERHTIPCSVQLDHCFLHFDISL